jgi:hypothetical protein
MRHIQLEADTVSGLTSCLWQLTPSLFTINGDKAGFKAFVSSDQYLQDGLSAS